MVPEKVIAPACAQTTSNPVGSGIRQASKASSRTSSANVPSPPSSSDETHCSTTVGPRPDPPAAWTAATACSAATTAPFMSTAPRPLMRPRSSAPVQGSALHGAVPGPTTSTCPLRLLALDVEADLAADHVGDGVDEHLGPFAGEVLVVQLAGGMGVREFVNKDAHPRVGRAL